MLVVAESSTALSAGESSSRVARHRRERDVGGGGAGLRPRGGSSRRALATERLVRDESDQADAAISPLPKSTRFPFRASARARRRDATEPFPRRLGISRVRVFCPSRVRRRRFDSTKAAATSASGGGDRDEGSSLLSSTRGTRLRAAATSRTAARTGAPSSQNTTTDSAPSPRRADRFSGVFSPPFLLRGETRPAAERACPARPPWHPGRHPALHSRAYSPEQRPSSSARTTAPLASASTNVFCTCPPRRPRRPCRRDATARRPPRRALAPDPCGQYRA